MRMTQIFRFLIPIFLIFSLRIEAQSNKPGLPTDTTKNSVETFLNNELNKSSLNTNSFERNYFSLPNSPVMLDTSTIWLQTRMQLGEMTENDPMKANFKSSIINPLRQQFADMESMKAIKYILATVQAGAVGYLAYKHIEKYGFLKRK